MFISCLPSRYGLISNSIIRTAVRVSLVFALAGMLICPNIAAAQGVPSWWGSAAWFDWSDYRGTAAVQLLLARLASGTVTKGSLEYNLVGGRFGITTDPEPFTEFWAEFYVDRLGIRGHAETHNFVGRPDNPPAGNLADLRLTKLEVDFSRVGVDLDLIRYPFLKLGVNVDYYFNPIGFRDRSVTVNTTDNPLYQSKEPLTLGIHGQAIPARVRDVPLIAHARFRFPAPFVSSDSLRPRITDWEIGAGVRPAIWDTSMFGHSTFSIAIEAGYRSINLDTSATWVPATDALTGLPINNVNNSVNELQLKARWQGVFFQVEAFF